jgi:peptidoglycan/LPS O-acetylase OafA/YrhL
MKKIYFNNLNGLRFFAASMVLVSHIEQIKDLRGLSSLHKSPLFSSLGTLGVVLFFVLSGFLITYLLIIEKETSQEKKISIKNFYMRRVLRIWPLYFIVIFLGLFLMPGLGFYEFTPRELFTQHNLGIIIPLFVFFLPNVVLVLFGGLPFLHQTWSIGTEEQFYLIWPFVITFSKKLLRSLAVLIVVYSAIKFGLYLFKSNDVIHKIYSIWSTLSIVSLSVGGVCAYVYHRYKNEFIKFSSSKGKQLCVFLAFIGFACLSSKIPSVIRFDIFSVFFGYLILSLVVQDSFSFLEFKAFNYLGKISYGLYMWHPIAITLSMAMLSSYAESNLWLYITSFALTIIMATFSYEFIEKVFLRLKNKYASL